jgi:predicted nucleotidyltransferase
MADDIRWQQCFSDYRKALERLEELLEPPALNEREQQAGAMGSGGNTMSNAAQNSESPCLSGFPQQAQHRLLVMLTAQPQVQRIWLFGSRAMGSKQPGSDLDFCLEAPQLSHSDRLRLLNAIDDLYFPWQVDLAMRHELPAELEAHVQRVGRCLWTQP